MMANYTFAQECEVRSLAALASQIQKKALRINECNGPCPLAKTLAKEIKALAKAIVCGARTVQGFDHKGDQREE